jgi:RHS repeat-associated protein
MAKANSLRFSTKFQDDETDLIYYGYRYLGASTGRWLNHDPLGDRPLSARRPNTRSEGYEKATLNLYPYNCLWNDVINKHDYLGLIHVGDSKPVECGAGSVTTKVGDIIVEKYESYNSAGAGGAIISLRFRKSENGACPCCPRGSYNWTSSIYEDTSPSTTHSVPYYDCEDNCPYYYNGEELATALGTGDLTFWDFPTESSSNLDVGDGTGRHRTITVRFYTCLVCEGINARLACFVWGFRYYYDPSGNMQVDLL